MRLWAPRGVPPARLTIPTNASRGTGQYLQLRPDGLSDRTASQTGRPDPYGLAVPRTSSRGVAAGTRPNIQLRSYGRCRVAPERGVGMRETRSPVETSAR